MRQLSIKTKLTISFLLASILPLTVISFYSYWKSQDSLLFSVGQQLEANRSLIKRNLEEHFKIIKNQLVILSHHHLTAEALTDFKNGFDLYKEQAKLNESELRLMKENLRSYYINQFEVEFSKQNEGKKTDSSEKLKLLSENQALMQSVYIAENKNPLGSKHLLDYAANNTSYDQAHQVHHPNFREYLERFKFYDIFLVDAESGNIVYSVYKELDFASSLKSGPYRDSPLGKAFDEALKLKKGDDIYMTDYGQYYPSYNAPAFFASAPIYKNNSLVGVIILQVSFDHLNDITLQDNQSYQTLETFIVGSDYLMRSHAKGDLTHRSVVSSFRHPEKGKINLKSIRQALNGDDETLEITKDYLGRNVIISSGPINILGNKWAISSMVTTEEAFKHIRELRWALLIGAFITAFIVVVMAILYTKKLSHQIIEVAIKLKESVQRVTENSNKVSVVSTRLSEASTEQAASLQQTVASVDQISAMVQKNADNTQDSLKTSEISEAAAKKGKVSVDLMMNSIQAISAGNEEIMQSMQKSNQEISEIIKVIQAIADKTKVINDIVFQTKLLSFNASVEAARAAEHGKGFAVVAEEVGNLAAMSGKAATDISEMLDESVKKVTSIVDATKLTMDSLIKRGKIKVEEGIKTAQDCSQAIDEIMKNVSAVNVLIKEISTASKEQSIGIQEITKAMSELDQVTQQNTISSNDASYSSKELKDQAHRLGSLVEILSIIVNGQSSLQHKNLSPDLKSPVQAAEKNYDQAKLPPVSVPSEKNIYDLTAFKKQKRTNDQVVTEDKNKNEINNNLISEQKPNLSAGPVDKMKKTVGLEFEVPSAHDDRFEDV